MEEVFITTPCCWSNKSFVDTATDGADCSQDRGQGIEQLLGYCEESLTIGYDDTETGCTNGIVNAIGWSDVAGEEPLIDFAWVCKSPEYSYSGEFDKDSCEKTVEETIQEFKLYALTPDQRCRLCNLLGRKIGFIFSIKGDETDFNYQMTDGDGCITNFTYTTTDNLVSLQYTGNTKSSCPKYIDGALVDVPSLVAA